MILETVNPATGRVIKSYDEMTMEVVQPILEELDKAQKVWCQQSFSARAEQLLKVADELGKQKESLALLMAIEMGKPVSAGIAEIEKCQWVCEYYAKEAESYCASKIIKTN